MRRNEKRRLKMRDQICRKKVRGVGCPERQVEKGFKEERVSNFANCSRETNELP